MSKYNHEGYLDPTAHDALSVISRKEKFRPIIYICSPYSGDVERNTENAKKYCRFAVDSGYIPIAPHIYFPQFMCDETERELAMFMDIALLSKCAELWVFGRKISKGMAQEIYKAECKGMPIKYFDEDLKQFYVEEAL